jgi:membrane-bound metal-dependent hydrolase YbcI (DUF457 family)
VPQDGIHAIVGMAARKWIPKKEWSWLGVVLGSMFPDLDNLAVAYATLAGMDTDGLHRTFTHSIFMIPAVIILFSVAAALTKNRRWNAFGISFGLGILLHSLLDLVLWFDGVELFWPIRYELNFWSWFREPDWLKILLQTGEFLAFGLYFLLLGSLARRHQTDTPRQASAKRWMYIQFILFLAFTILFFIAGAEGVLYTIFGALYLLSLVVAIIITIRMRNTVETFR